MTNQVIFDLEQEMQTSDNYYVRLKGFLETPDDLDEAEVIEGVLASCKRHIEQLTLMDALDLVVPENAAPIRSGITGFEVTKFEISTVDALEVQDTTLVDVDIDPSLENQRQSSGILGKLKSIFRR